MFSEFASLFHCRTCHEILASRAGVRNISMSKRKGSTGGEARSQKAVKVKEEQQSCFDPHYIKLYQQWWLL